MQRDRLYQGQGQDVVEGGGEAFDGVANAAKDVERALNEPDVQNRAWFRHRGRRDAIRRRLVDQAILGELEKLMEGNISESGGMMTVGLMPQKRTFKEGAHGQLHIIW